MKNIVALIILVAAIAGAQISSNGGGGGGGTPGGSNGQIQYNNSGAFGGLTAGNTCTSQVITAISPTIAGTCTTLTSAYTTGTFPATAHNILSTTHGDTTAAAAVRGDGFFAIGATPTWQRLAHPSTTGGYFKWNGTDVVASTGAASGTGSCTNQAVIAANADAAPTCATLTSAYVDTSIASSTQVFALDAYSTSQLDCDNSGTKCGANGTTLTAIPGLSVTLASSGIYDFQIDLLTTAGASGGVKVDLGGGGTSATAVRWSAVATATGSNVTAFGMNNTSLTSSVGVTGTRELIVIYGYISVSTGGTFIPRFAQNATNATVSSVFVGSAMHFHRQG